MGIVQKDAFKTTVISYLGLFLGYVNKVVLFIWFLSTEQIGLINLILAVGLLFAQLSNLGTVYVTWRFFPFFRNEQKKHYGFLLANSLLVLFGILVFGSLFYKTKKSDLVDQTSLFYFVGLRTFPFSTFPDY